MDPGARRRGADTITLVAKGEFEVGPAGPVQEQSVAIPTGAASIAADLAVPPRARGVIAFAHGSGSSRFSPRNRFVARFLHQDGWATLLTDLLTSEEEVYDQQTGSLRFDIGLLAGRLESAIVWLIEDAATGLLPIGLFGASTGAAAALVVASRLPESIGAVVSRGGRPDLAGEALGRINAPTLLIVGGEDVHVLALNRQALAILPGVKRLDVVPRAGHLFEEPGALQHVGSLAAGWFRKHLGSAGSLTHGVEK